MFRHGVGVLLGLLMLAGLTGRVAAGEGEEPKKEAVAKEAPAAKEKAVDEYRSAISKLSAARRKFILSKPELAEAYKQFDERMKQIEKERAEFYAKLRTMSPEIDELEKKKEELEAERKRKVEEARKAKGERKPKKKE
ncbi:MAG TPA: hypothetical protein VNE39_04370 [Planctomycetota bacterium]|nr:hypothetical protein [Planctomycetota bacterium]